MYIYLLSYSNFSESIRVPMFMISSKYYMPDLNFATKNKITQKSVQQTTFSSLYQSIHLKTLLSHQKRNKEKKKKTYKAIIINSENILLLGEMEGKGMTS